MVNTGIYACACPLLLSASLSRRITNTQLHRDVYHAFAYQGISFYASACTLPAVLRSSASTFLASCVYLAVSEAYAAQLSVHIPRFIFYFFELIEHAVVSA